MEKNEIKKTLYKEKPNAIKTGVSSEGSVTYLAKSSYGQHMFLVPKEEAVAFKNSEPAQLLIRWLTYEK